MEERRECFIKHGFTEKLNVIKVSARAKVYINLKRVFILLI